MGVKGREFAAPSWSAVCGRTMVQACAARCSGKPRHPLLRTAGNKPAELPVRQLTRTELIINLWGAKSRGICSPPTLLARTTRAIEQARNTGWLPIVSLGTELAALKGQGVATT